MGADPEDAPEVDENLAKSFETIQGTIRGRGIAKFNVLPNDCVCRRPYTHVMCLNCGHLMFGRVRYRCPKHTMVTFLIDITNCPKCKSFEYMLNEFSIDANQDKIEDSDEEL